MIEHEHEGERYKLEYRGDGFLKLRRAPGYGRPWPPDAVVSAWAGVELTPGAQYSDYKWYWVTM